MNVVYSTFFILTPSDKTHCIYIEKKRRTSIVSGDNFSVNDSFQALEEKSLFLFYVSFVIRLSVITGTSSLRCFMLLMMMLLDGIIVYALEQWTKSKYEIIWNKLQNFLEKMHKNACLSSQRAYSESFSFINFIDCLAKSVCITVGELSLHWHSFLVVIMREIHNSA